MEGKVQRKEEIGLLYVLILLATRISCGNGGEEIFKWAGENLMVNQHLDADIFFEIIEPPELEYTYRLRPAMDFGTPFNSSFLEKGIGLTPIEPPDGCEFATNAKELKGKIALIQRGSCSFFLKTKLAEQAGAKAVMIADYYPSSTEEALSSPMWVDYYYVEMVRDDDVPEFDSVNIPAGYILGVNGRMIRQVLHRLNRQFALVNIPVNLTHSTVDKVYQPPWIPW